MSKGMGFSLDCKALGVAGAEGMCGGGQERRTQGRQGQLVESLTCHSRRDGALSCRPQGVPEGFVEWREVTRCTFRKIPLATCGREWRGGRETGKRLWTESGEDDGGQTRALAIAMGRL